MVKIIFSAVKKHKSFQLVIIVSYQTEQATDFVGYHFAESRRRPGLT